MGQPISKSIKDKGDGRCLTAKASRGCVYKFNARNRQIMFIRQFNYLGIILHDKVSAVPNYLMAFDISHDVVASLVLERFHKT